MKIKKGKNWTVWGVIDECANQAWSNHKDADGRRQAALLMLGYSARELGTSRAEVSPSQLDAGVVLGMYRRMRAGGLSNATINRRASAFFGALKWGRENGLHDAHVVKVKRQKESSGRTRVVSPQELEAVAFHLPNQPGADGHSGLLARFLYASGLRVSEALALQWRDVNRDPLSGRPTSATVRVSKNGLSRTVPLTSTAAACLEKASAVGLDMEPSTDPVFEVHQSKFNRAWAGARRSMGLENDPEFVPHALRHSCATRLVLSGVPLPVVQKWMGHKNIQTTMRYAHVHDEALLDAAERVERLAR